MTKVLRAGSVEIPQVTKKDAIADLAILSASLQKAYFALLEECNRLQEEVEQLAKKSQEEMPREYFSSLLARMIKAGKIPVPNEILQFGVPVDIICRPQDVSCLHDGISAGVVFDSNGYSREIRFKFIPVPTTDMAYPDFHMGYTKPKPVAPKRVRVRTKKAKVTPPATT